MRRRAETAHASGDVLPGELLRIPSLLRAQLTAEGRLEEYTADWEARRQAWAAERELNTEEFAEREHQARFPNARPGAYERWGRK